MYHVANAKEFKEITNAFDKYYGISGECSNALNEIDKINTL